MTPDAIAEDGDVPAPPRERVDHVDRLCEGRVLGVDDLGQEDKVHAG